MPLFDREIGPGLRRIAEAIEATARDNTFRSEVLKSLTILRKQGETIMSHVERLIATVERLETVQDSVLALLAGLSQQIKDAGIDQEKLTALTDKLDAQAQEYVDAVTANTPEPEPEPV